MGKQYTVHSHHVTIVNEPVETADGHKILGQMPASVIELVPLKGGATVTLTERTPTKESQAEVAALFPEGGTVEMGEFTLVSGPKE